MSGEAPKKPLSETVAINRIMTILSKLPSDAARKRVMTYVSSVAHDGGTQPSDGEDPFA